MASELLGYILKDFQTFKLLRKGAAEEARKNGIIRLYRDNWTRLDLFEQLLARVRTLRRAYGEVRVQSVAFYAVSAIRNEIAEPGYGIAGMDPSPGWNAAGRDIPPPGLAGPYLRADTTGDDYLDSAIFARVDPAPEPLPLAGPGRLALTLGGLRVAPPGPYALDAPEAPALPFPAPPGGEVGT